MNVFKTHIEDVPSKQKMNKKPLSFVVKAKERIQIVYEPVDFQLAPVFPLQLRTRSALCKSKLKELQYYRRK